MADYKLNKYNWLTRFYQYIVIYLLFIPVYYIFYRLKVYGKENIPKDKKPFIVMPNHLSNNDPPIVSTVVESPIAWMAKKELYSVPFLASAISKLGAFLVDRENVSKSTIKATKYIISKKWSVGVFLEGTRSKIPGRLGNPNLGSAYISNLNNVPILPVGIVGSNKLFGPITVRIGKLFYPGKDLEIARWQCAEKLSELTGLKMPDKENEPAVGR
ncbi:MAG: hypothetical protein A3B68_07705 [Candidatus Melainabacteria bacterium RIFCSPHIGHO2_02_FULL_34_12]|nr:MAG: hypothetical protein A3B68_07705 [Candidatus Melainabacteria bacterium RIFCSPHIGHO2_02_FULL_34_12]